LLVNILLMLQEILDQLESHYGKPGPGSAGGPLEMILWENVAYLVNEERRKHTFKQLKQQLGTKPREVLDAPLKDLERALEGGGIIIDQRARKIRRIMEIVLDEFEGDLNQVLDFPSQKALKALQLFPGIGEPGAEKILMFNRRLRVLALESNGLRVLLRLGYGSEEKNYAATYHSVRKAIQGKIIDTYDWLIRAHQLLRIHGQQLCKRNRPRCNDCPLIQICLYPRAHRQH
jgi:endonuclease-3